MGSLTLNGSTSGQITLNPPAIAGTNTLSLPAATGTLIYGTQPSGTLVGTTDTQTLTNKTLTSPTITGANMSSMASSVITSGTAQASTSGTSIDFTSIPSWVKRITVMFNSVSLSGTANFLVQVGAGSVTTTGYSSSSAFGGNANTSTSGFIIQSGSAASTYIGAMTITTLGSNIWVETSMVRSAASATDGGGTGVVTLSGSLDRVRITTTNGTDTFDAGSINILYE